MRGARRSSLGKDVAKALGYSNTSKAIQQHVDKEDKGTLPFWETAYETRAGTGSGKASYHASRSSLAFSSTAFLMNALMEIPSLRANIAI